MNDFLSHIPLIKNLTDLVEWLLLLNAVLTGAVILLAFRATAYKQRAEELESELNEAIGDTITRESKEQPVTFRRSR